MNIKTKPLKLLQFKFLRSMFKKQFKRGFFEITSRKNYKKTDTYDFAAWNILMFGHFLRFKFLLLISILSFLSSCNPFAKYSLVDIINQPSLELQNQKTQVQIVSGGAKTSHTLSLSSNSHSIETSVGTTFQNTRIVTSKGSTIELSVGGVQK